MPNLKNLIKLDLELTP